MEEIKKGGDLPTQGIVMLSANSGYPKHLVKAGVVGVLLDFLSKTAAIRPLKRPFQPAVIWPFQWFRSMLVPLAHPFKKKGCQKPCETGEGPGQAHNPKSPLTTGGAK